MIEIVGTGVVYRNPKPFLRAVHAWHPSLVRLPAGDLLAAFDLGQGPESLDYRTYLARSHDEGRSWSAPVPLVRGGTGPGTTHSIRIGRVGDGTLVGFGGRYHRDDPEEGLVNRANLGYVRMDLVLTRSRDGGLTWSGPDAIDPPLVGPAFEVCHRVIELRDGRWLAPTSTWKGWDGQAPNGMKAVALVSRDQGRTWPEYLDVMDGYRDKVIYWEQSVAELPDGRLLAVAWAFDEAAGRSRPNPYILSADGRTFGPPQPTGLHGQTAKILSLDDGRLLCLYRRDDRPGLWAQLVHIDGDRWVNLDEAPVWQGAASGMTGRANASDELSGLKFGFPSMARLPGGDVGAVFWCCEECLYGIRWVRLRVG